MNLDYLKHLGFTQTAITMSNTTQLPAEWQQRIDEETQSYAEYSSHLSPHIAYRAGATAYAVKLHEAQQEIESLTNQLKKQNEVQVENMKLLRKENERLKGWKSEAIALLDPILKYGQSKEANIPLGKSIVDKVLERCKGYDNARTLLENFISWHESGLLPDKKLYIAIKTFLDGK